MKIYRIEEILQHLESCIIQNKPFSHIRFGDGGLKYIDAILKADMHQINIICHKEGIPTQKVIHFLEWWGYYARRADYIDTPEVYYNDTFWERIKKVGKPINYETDQILRNWKDLYSRAEFDNENYCNPESNCLMILKIKKRTNLIDLMKDKKLCIITAKEEIKDLFPGIDLIRIVGQYEKHYIKCYDMVMNIIKKTAPNYDFWLVSAGEIGRVYSGYIKECGGRSLDIGFVANYWVENYLHPRFTPFLKRIEGNPFELELTDIGYKYIEHI